MAHSVTFSLWNRDNAARKQLLSGVGAAVMILLATDCKSLGPSDVREGERAALTAWGAKCNGDGANADRDTRAAQAVVATGQDLYLPANTYCIFNAPIVLKRTGQRIVGDGPQSSKIMIYTVFGEDRSGGFREGVLNLEAPAQQVRGIGIAFSQPPHPAGRADLTTYQPAIRARQAAVVLDDLLLTGGTTCIDMGGNSNSGNSYLSEVDTGCYDFGIRIDGAIDTVHIHMHHHYPFQMNEVQRALFQREDNVAIDMGRVDDFSIDDSLCLGTTCLNLYEGVQGSAFGTVVNYDFDGAANGILMQANGSLAGSALTFSAGNSRQHAITQSSGRIIISGSSFFTAKATVMDQFSGGLQTITGSEWNQNNQDAPAIVAKCRDGANIIPTTKSATACRLTLTGNTVERDPSMFFHNPWLQSDGSEVVVGSSNSVNASARGGVFASIKSDTAGNRWFGNSAPGWESKLAGEAMPDIRSRSGHKGRYFGN